MKTAFLFKRALGCTIVLVLSLVGCNENGDRLPLATSEHLNAVDERIAMIQAESSQSETTAFPKVSIPGDKPEDVPIFPDAVPTFVFGSEIITIRLESSNSIEEVQGFYVSELQRLGWRLVHKSLGNLQGRKSLNRLVNVDLIEDGDVLVLSVQYN